jgi:hypothetical protein
VVVAINNGFHYFRRLGVHEGSTKCIADHTFFSVLDLVALNDGKVVPEYIPNKSTVHEPLSNLTPVRPFNGDQSLFAEF